MRLGFLSAVLLSGLLFFTAGVSCAAGEQSRHWRVALVLPGPISDRGFNAEAYAGLMRIKTELGVEVSFSESTEVANYERVVRGFADDGVDILIMHGLEFVDLARRIAPEYPRQIFLVTDGSGLGGPNVASLRVKSEDAAFVCGVLAGLTTRTNKIGAVLGFDFPLLVAQAEALRLGARSVNPKSEVEVSYLGTFDDPVRAKEAALAQIDSGADVLYHIADNAGLGVIQAGQEKGVKVIGWGIDQNPLAPANVICSELIKTGNLMVAEVTTIKAGRFTGLPIVAGFGEGGVALSDYHGLVPAQVAALVAKWEKAFADGRLKLSYTTRRDGATNAPAVMLPAEVVTQ